MKCKLFILLSWLIAMPAMAIVHTYADHSVLSSGNWVKIRVSESGIHKISYEQLANAGLNPQNVRIYGYGGAMLSQDFMQRKIDDLPAVPFWMEKGNDGIFGAGDYILFYAQANIHWTYTNGTFTHTRNPYSDYGYYFLSDNAGEQVLIPTATAIDGTDAVSVDTYTNYQVHEQDLVNLLDVTKGCDGGGREFYGESFSSSVTSRSFNFTFPDLITTQPIQGIVHLAAYSSDKTSFAIQLGSTEYVTSIAATSVTETYVYGKTTTLNKSFTPIDDDYQTMTIRYKIASTSSALGYLNYIELLAPCRLVMHNQPLSFRTKEQYGDPTPIQYMLSNANSRTQVWNITQLDSIYRMPTTLEDSELSFFGCNLNRIEQFIAFDPSQGGWKEPTFLGAVNTQDLHVLNDIDFVIITPVEFLSDAQRLAKAHEDYDHMTTAVVTDAQVYNEFSSGTPDVTAYRWFMKMLYDRGINGAHKPSHLLLFGDGTFDNRQLLINPYTGYSTGGKAWILTYQTVNSTTETDALPIDDYMAFMDNNEGLEDAKGTMEFGVGRFPITSVAESKAMTDKAIAYIQNNHLGSWKSQLLFIADDGDGGLHTQTAEAGAENVRKKNPDFIVNKVYLDAYPQETGASGESYPLAKNKIDNLLNQGILYMNYSGHGGYNGITNEGIMNINSIQKMTNANQGLWMLATCSFAHFDSGKQCAAEEAVLNPNGAALAVLSACRTVYANQNATINRHFCDTLFGHKDVFHYEMTMGQATRIAKNNTGKNDNNKLAYVLLGDPAIRLNYPTQFQVRTTSCQDTIRAISTNMLSGEIIDSTGTTMDWFNGKMQIWIYDKLQQVTTRDNDQTTESQKKRIVYNDYPNLIFSGEINVENGIFSTYFMTPKDIRYNYGAGRIVYYAYDTVYNAEAVGHYEQFTIGGSSVVAIVDTVGPEMNIYLNSSSFKDGGETHEYPRFFAELEDEHGINTVGSGIGHDLLMVIDESPLQTYVLNSYYQVQDGDFTKGLISYKMDLQTEGQHQLRFRAWDLLNNSSTKYLNYTVVTGRNTEIYRMVAYPNPAPVHSTLTIAIDYDHPDELVETHIYFYDMTGRMIHYQSQDDVKNIQCNLSELGLTQGIYAYQVKVKTKTTSFVTKTSKLYITD